jgi:RimJ/RimL family protein N-acetyltransferase
VNAAPAHGWRLRDLEHADAGWIARACTDAEIQRWTLVPRPYALAHAEAFVAGRHDERRVWVIAEAGPSAASPSVAGAEGPDGAAGAGVISVHGIDAAGDAELGWWVAPWARRRGAATTALGLVCVVLAADGGVRRAVAKIAGTNVASLAAARAAGFSVVDGACTDACPDGADRVPAVVVGRSLR